MRTCIIFNPTAKGNKARHFRHHLDEFAGESTFKMTAAKGDARNLAAQAVEEGFEIIVAAGGDGTLNEVLNGIMDAPKGFERARLGVLPLGTINVFAREVRIPLKLQHAWETIRAGHETLIDLGAVDYPENGAPARRYFAQLAGAGLDARAIELVDWRLKKKIGPLAYVVAGLRALREPQKKIQVTNGKANGVGELVLIGNGSLYGGEFRIFPPADMRDGLLEACVFSRVNWLTLFRCAPRLLIRGTLPSAATANYRSESLTLTSESRVPFEVDGEFGGYLPATFSMRRMQLRVIVPPISGSDTRKPAGDFAIPSASS
ncbi:MAG TPA: diacylglycerol kinase family protein [Candidatus Angelobacter sp.]|nr:diacylglycerol kinase family protein [Candidatus Angelobacter sp.]